MMARFHMVGCFTVEAHFDSLVFFSCEARNAISGV